MNKIKSWPIFFIYLSCKRGIVGWWRAGKPVSDCLPLGGGVLSFHIWWQWVGASHPCNTISQICLPKILSHHFKEYHSLKHYYSNFYLFDPIKNPLHCVCCTHETILTWIWLRKLMAHRKEHLKIWVPLTKSLCHASVFWNAQKRSSHHFTQSHVWVVWGLLKDWNKRQTIFMPQCFMVMLSCCQVPLKFVAGKKIFAIKRCNLQWKWNHISQKNMRPLRAIKLYQLFLINVQCLHAWPKHFLPCSNLVQLLLKNNTHMSMLVLMITCRTFCLIINTVKDD